MLFSKAKEFTERCKQFFSDEMPVQHYVANDTMTLLKALDAKIPDSYLCTAFLCEEAERLTPHWFSTNLQKYIYPELKQLKEITIKLSIEQRSTFEEPNSFTSDLSIKVFGKIMNIMRCMLYTLQTQQAQVFEIKDIYMCQSRINELM